MCVIYLFMQFNRSLLFFFLIHLELKIFFFALLKPVTFWKGDASAICINFNVII